MSDNDISNVKWLSQNNKVSFVLKWQKAALTFRIVTQKAVSGDFYISPRDICQKYTCVCLSYNFFSLLNIKIALVSLLNHDVVELSEVTTILVCFKH